MELSELVRLSLAEDVGPGDLTTLATVPAEARGHGFVKAKQTLVVAGQSAAAEVFRQVGADYEVLVADGIEVEAGRRIAGVKGPLRAILTGERTALNLLMRLSGIATCTRRHVEAAAGSFSVVDTRKTTPLHRVLEKAAVRAGGGRNHRFALFDGLLVKDNHITACPGGLSEAVRLAKAGAHHLLKVEVEVKDLDEALLALTAGADALLLDNMDDDTLARVVVAVRNVAPTVPLEASGNMDETRLARLVARNIRPDLVSVGGLIHQARWADLSLKISNEPV